MSGEQSKKSPSTGLQEEAAMPYRPDAEGTDARPSGIESVQRRHERALMELPGVTGVGIGRTATGDDTLIVYLSDASAQAQVPAQIDGHPVQTRVTGPIDAY